MMFPARFFIALILFLSLLFGALFFLPRENKEFTRVTIGSASLTAEVVKSPDSRAVGLGGRKQIPESSGMLFSFEHPDRYQIWMKNMFFPIDVFWIRDGRIVDMEENLIPPPRGTTDAFLPIYTPDAVAGFILETRAGFAEKFNIKIGDLVTIQSDAVIHSVDAGYAKNYSQELKKGREYFIETLRMHPPEGKDFNIDQLLSSNEAYQKFLISYLSDNLRISGVMNVPVGDIPPEGYPVLILNHGLISPSLYVSGRGSKREQDFFARRGYITIHPDYRGLAFSDPILESHYDFYVGYTKDIVALVDALHGLTSNLVDVHRIGVWGHSMGGGIATRVMVLRPDIRAYVLFASISADAKENFYELSYEETAWLEATYGTSSAAEETYKKISPIEYFQDVSAPVQVHHGTADSAVPMAFSEQITRTLQTYDKNVEFFIYPGEGHEFGNGWALAAERSLQFFDRYVKNTR